jgi:hypothetical protein
MDRQTFIAMTYSPLGGRHTGKRRIQIRQFITERGLQSKRQSTPFAAEDENVPTSNLLNVRPMKLSFKTQFVIEAEPDPVDEILSSKINLDEADRFIAVLRMPTRRTPVRAHGPVKPAALAPVDLSSFREESERIERMRMAEVQDPSETDDDLI